MQNFKVGDWVRIKTDTFEYDGTASISKGVKQLSKSNMWLFSENHYKCNPDKYIEPWKPKVGEWCWFLNNNKEPILKQFLQMCPIVPTNYISKQGTISGSVEPFIGQLPSFLKDNT